MEALNALITKAREEGKWLYSNYQGLWFSPDELQTANTNGKFLWGPENWTLRSPNDLVDGALARVKGAHEDLERVKQLVLNSK